MLRINSLGLTWLNSKGSVKLVSAISVSQISPSPHHLSKNFKIQGLFDSASVVLFFSLPQLAMAAGNDKNPSCTQISSGESEW